MGRASSGLLALPLSLLAAFAALGCTKSQLVDLAMSGAEHVPSTRAMRVGDRLVLAGDMHCHVQPPDAPYHVSRGVESTLSLAESEGLDFVVLTPHVQRRFFMNDAARSWVLETQAELRERIHDLQVAQGRYPELLVIPGFEYTDFEYGHVGVSFGDPVEVLRTLDAADAREHPSLFFERWVASGGILTINHPVNLGLPESPFAELRWDMSWRVFSSPSGGAGVVSAPPEVTWITEHAQAIEAFNTSVTHLRDQFLLGEEDRSLREVSHLVDRTARAQHRKIAAVGGSDSHGEWLRATTFVLAKERSRPALRAALAEARTCVRGPDACTLQVHVNEAPESAWAGVGDSASTHAARLDVRTESPEGADATYLVNGVIAATVSAGTTTRIAIPQDRCAIVRAVVGRSWSSGIYVNCDF